MRTLALIECEKEKKRKEGRKKTKGRKEIQKEKENINYFEIIL